MSTEVVYLQRWHGWCHMKLLPSRCVLCTPYNHVPCHFMQSHIHKVHACSAVTCYLHFWQNDRNILHGTAVTPGWNRYRHKSTESWPWRRRFSHRSCQDSNPQPFPSRVRHSNHWAIPSLNLVSPRSDQASSTHYWLADSSSVQAPTRKNTPQLDRPSTPHSDLSTPVPSSAGKNTPTSGSTRRSSSVAVEERSIVPGGAPVQQ